jgi:hypothetical protein
MIRFAVWCPVILLALAPAALAKSKHDVPRMTCEEFAAHSSEHQERVAAYLDGYSKRGQPVEQVVDVDVERDVDVLVIACKETPKATVWDKLRAKLPGGKKKVKPVKMLCEEYLSYTSDEQDDVAYWLAGYHGTTVAGADEVDVEKDVAVLVEECRVAPKASVWERIKGKF